MKTELTDEAAIRQVILEGIGGDFCDVAKVVSDRFKLDVSASQVEEIYGRIRDEMTQMKTDPGSVRPDEKKPIRIGRVGLSMQTDVARSGQPDPGETLDSAAAAEATKDPVLAFVESMGGFDAARAAITNLEVSVKQLLK